MPTYSYACPECGHAFDIRQSFSDDALTVCPECNATTLRKVIHPVGIAFKGSGFYKTDSRAAASNGSNGSNGSSGAKGSNGSSASDGAGTRTESSGAGASPSSEGASSASTSPAPAAPAAASSTSG